MAVWALIGQTSRYEPRAGVLPDPESERQGAPRHVHDLRDGPARDLGWSDFRSARLVVGKRLLAEHDVEPGRFRHRDWAVVGVTMGKIGTALIPVYIARLALS